MLKDLVDTGATATCVSAIFVHSSSIYIYSNQLTLMSFFKKKTKMWIKKTIVQRTKTLYVVKTIALIVFLETNKNADTAI